MPAHAELQGQQLDQALLRLGLFGAGLVCIETAFVIWLQGQAIFQLASLLINLLWSLLGLALIVLALVRRPEPQLVWLILVGVLGSFWLHSYLFDLSFTPATFSRTDSEMITQYALEVLKRGENPYSWDYSDYLSVYRDRGLYVTPLLDGSIQHRASYPALAYELLYACDLLGVGDVPTVMRCFHALMLVLLFFGAAPRYRPLILLPAVLLEGFTGFSLIGINDVVWCCFLLAMLLSWRRPFVRALFFGLACAYRQQPWFLAPFLLVALWHEGGSLRQRLRRVALFSAVPLALFALTNLPFIIWDPLAWAQGTFEHTYAPFNLFSSGLSILSQYQLLPFPRSFYTGLQLAALLVLLWLHWRHPRWVGQAYWSFPLLYFWLYYRSLPHYWIYWIPPLLLALLGRRVVPAAPVAGPDTPVAAPAPAGRWRLTLAVGALPLAALLVWGAALLAREPAVELQWSGNAQLGPQELVQSLEVSVSNRSARTLTPSFAVRHLRGIQPLPWLAQGGPDRLAPGQSSRYTISPPADLPQRTFSLAQGAQLVVSDGGGDYALYATAVISQASSGEATAGEIASSGSSLSREDSYYVERGHSYRQQHNFELAERAYRRALRLNPANPEARYGLGEALFWMGRWPEATTSFRQSIAAGHQLLLSYKGLGWSLFNQGDSAQAEVMFLKALGLARSTSAAAAVHLADCHKGLGMIQLARGNCAAARSSFTAARVLSEEITLPELDPRSCPAGP